MIAAVVVLVALVAALLFASGVAVGRSRCGHVSVCAPGPVRYVPWWPPAEPWRANHPDAILVPVEFLAAIADRRIVATCRRLQHERDRVACQRERLLTEGQTHPLQITVDEAGQAMLSDGYHRLLAMIDLGWPHAAVTRQRSPRIRAAGVPLVDVLETLGALPPASTSE